MILFQNYLFLFSDTFLGHTALAMYLYAVTDERSLPGYLRKLPPLLLSPLTAAAVSLGLNIALPGQQVLSYTILSLAILAMCTLWMMRAWKLNFWKAFSTVCMGGILQVATSTLSQILLFIDITRPFAALAASYFLFSFSAAMLLKKLHFGTWFQLLLEDEKNQRRTTLLIFALELVMEAFLLLNGGVLESYLPAYYLLVIALVTLIAGLIVYLAQRFGASRMLQAQQDIIAQQQLYEQNLEDIRREVRSFRHDYKNLLSSLSQQAKDGELDSLRRTLLDLDADFDQRLGEKIQASTQIGNLQIPQVRSLLLSKLTAMRSNGVECRLEVLYPMETVGMDVWDFVRCLGILTDNAMEAALETEHSWIEIVLLARKNRVSLRVSNSWNEAANPSRFWEEGWSTKGTGRGLGLSGYRRILKGYPNASCSASWKDGVFVQELVISS